MRRGRRLGTLGRERVVVGYYLFVHPTSLKFFKNQKSTLTTLTEPWLNFWSNYSASPWFKVSKSNTQLDLDHYPLGVNEPYSFFSLPDQPCSIPYWQSVCSFQLCLCHWYVWDLCKSWITKILLLPPPPLFFFSRMLWSVCPVIHFVTPFCHFVTPFCHFGLLYLCFLSHFTSPSFVSFCHIGLLTWYEVQYDPPCQPCCALTPLIPQAVVLDPTGALNVWGFESLWVTLDLLPCHILFFGFICGSILFQQSGSHRIENLDVQSRYVFGVLVRYNDEELFLFVKFFQQNLYCVFACNENLMCFWG